MRVFVTGATGFIGLATVKELIGAGHTVLGLSRSDAGAENLKAAGAEPLRGTIEDLHLLQQGAASSDGVIHLAFNHDWSKFAENCAADGRAIEALGAALKGTEKPLLTTAGMATQAQGRTSTEQDAPIPRTERFPRVSEEAAMELAAQGVRASVVRLPQVHDPLKQGLVSYLVAVARAKGESAYVGDGQNRWPAAHRLDVARLYRLALERGAKGEKYHAVAEEGLPARAFAEVIGRKMGIPVVSKTQAEAMEHFGWMGMFAGLDMPASSEWTRKTLGWEPTGPGMMEDLEKGEFLNL